MNARGRFLPSRSASMVLTIAFLAAVVAPASTAVSYLADRVEPSFVYAAKVVDVVDGDTIDVLIDLGFKTFSEQRIRVLGIDCPEVKGKTKKAGDAATEATRTWVKSHGSIVVRTVKAKKGQIDSFGRYLAEVLGDNQAGTQSSLGEFLLSEGHAKAYRE